MLSDRGLDEETPESDAQDLTEADRTIFKAESSVVGEFEEIIGFVEFNMGQDDEITDCTGEPIDFEDVELISDESAEFGFERQRAGEQLVGL